ncbi:MAG: hypothetical protein ACRD2L_12695, partial [Terriglobia bacterium]
MSINQSYDPEVLHRFIDAVGVGNVYGPYPDVKGVERYNIQLVSQNAFIALGKIWPWLSGVKRRQIEAAVEKFNFPLEPSRRVIAPSGMHNMDHELAWAAGFWDGEGSCGCYQKNDGRTRKASNFYLRAAISQKDREVLDRFRAAVELGKVYGPYSKGTTPWSWQVAGKQVHHLFGKLSDLLSGPKRNQYIAVQEKFAQRPEPSPQGLGGTRPCPPGCTCGRHNRYSTEGLTESQLRRRKKMREYQRQHRLRKKAKEILANASV